MKVRNSKFDTQKCFEYINNIKDGEIIVDAGSKVIDSKRRIVVMLDKVFFKKHLLDFLIESKKESENSVSDFLEWLKARKDHWRGEQYKVISELNQRLEEAEDNLKKKKLEADIINFLDFFGHNQRLIALIETDVREREIESWGVESKETDLPENFKGIFTVKNYKRYISAFEKTTPILLNREWEFIGKPKKHKGVICAWIRHLQYDGIIKQSVSRSQLAFILNKELKNFNLGKDGKTFDNISSEFDKNFKEQLISITK